MNVNFLKLDINILDDSKIKIIRKYPDGDSLLALWIGLLCLGMKSDRPGYIYVTQGVPYEPEELANELSIEIKTLKLGLNLFARYKMIAIMEGGTIEIINFNRHQNIDKIDTVKEQSRESSRKYREKKRNELIAIKKVTYGDITRDSHDKESDSTDTDTDTDLDPDPDPDPEKKETPFSPPREIPYHHSSQEISGYIHRWNQYPNLPACKLTILQLGSKLSDIRDQLQPYLPVEIEKSFSNFSAILKDKERYPHPIRYPTGIKGFLMKGIHVYGDHANPFEQFRDPEYEEPIVMTERQRKIMESITGGKL